MQQQTIAQLKMQLKSSGFSNSKFKVTPKREEMALFGIQSPKIIDTERSRLSNISMVSNPQIPIRILQQNTSHLNSQTNSDLSFNPSSDNKDKSARKKGSKSNSTKRKKTKLSKTMDNRVENNGSRSQDIKQMNLTKVFELRDCEGNDVTNDMNLLDQTFSGLILEDYENIEPSLLQRKPNLPSPNTIINNKLKLEASNKKEKEHFQ